MLIYFNVYILPITGGHPTTPSTPCRPLAGIHRLHGGDGRPTRDHAHDGPGGAARREGHAQREGHRRLHQRR